jgi:hypothetical protein
MELVDGANLALEPSFMAAPQTPVGTWADATRQAQLGDIIDDLLSEFPDDIDPTRIYVTGLSMGGNGTWATIATYPTRFAAAVAICGWANQASAPSLTELPIWAFHAANDQTVGVAGSRNMIAALRAAGGNPIYTEYATGGHGIWNVTYNLPHLFAWLIAQRQGVSEAAAAPLLRIQSPSADATTTVASAGPIDLAGIAAEAGTGISSLEWTSTAPGSGTPVGTTSWAAANVPLAGTGTTIRVTARGPSDHPPWAGERSWSDTVRVVVVPAPPAPGTVALAVESGGNDYLAADGTLFAADTSFVGGSTQSSSHAINGTDDDELFNAWRWGAFSYLASVAPGLYSIDLYFAETYNTAAGQRVFDLEIENHLVEDNLDIAAVAGLDTALIRTHVVEVLDGELEIRLVVGSAGNPRLDAFRATYLGPPATIFADGFETGSTSRWSPTE